MKDGYCSKREKGVRGGLPGKLISISKENISELTSDKFCMVDSGYQVYIFVILMYESCI